MGRVGRSCQVASSWPAASTKTRVFGRGACLGYAGSESISSGRGRRTLGVGRVARFRVLLQRASVGHPWPTRAQPPRHDVLHGLCDRLFYGQKQRLLPLSANCQSATLTASPGSAFCSNGGAYKPAMENASIWRLTLLPTAQVIAGPSHQVQHEIAVLLIQIGQPCAEDGGLIVWLS